ncbi:MAG TPA: hypothetical protein VMY37_09770 [Thermoguttaceae bacterium]|nr:hypothetical protein [Thermoguttaceae bacterium]
MTLNELLPTLHALPRAEKLRLIQLLAADVAREDGIELADTQSAYPVWSPYDAFDGAAALLRVLAEEKAAS